MIKILRRSLLAILIMVLGSGCAHKPAPAPQATLPIAKEHQEVGAKTLFYSSSGAVVLPGGDSQTFSTLPSGKVEQKKKPKKEPNVIAESGKYGKEYMGIRYWLLLEDQTGRKMSLVRTNRVFKTGERIKLALESNKDGYLTVIHQGSTGQSYIFLPHPSIAGGSNSIKARNLYYFPPHNAHLTFDENPGEEILLLFFSPTPKDELAFISKGSGILKPEETARLLEVGQIQGTKDLILEIDDSSNNPGNYVVAPRPSLEKKLLFIQIRLKHAP